MTVAAALPVLSTGAVVLGISAVLFGSAFLAITAATTALIRQERPAEQWAATIAGFTVWFAAGQTVGPVLAGAIADLVGLRGGLAAAAALLVLATGVAGLQWRMLRGAGRGGCQPRA